MSTEVLEVRCEGALVGTLTRRNGRESFIYDDAWRHRPQATPMSLSMPLAARHHGHDVVNAFLWGLLPDNEAVITRWARDFGVSAAHPFGLLAAVGRDLPGSMQLIDPDDESERSGGGVEWLSDGDVAHLLASVRRDQTAWLGTSGADRWSLAGAQPKIALRYDAEAGRWARPWGRVATTHILKPAIEGLDDHDLNEHLCLRAAGSLGLRVARTSVMAFDDQRAIVVERYDRGGRDGGLQRIHQEDLCQALGVHPSRKYQSDGGPSPKAIIDLLRSSMSPDRAEADVATFIDALLLNWLIVGPDAHAKNYALLLAGGQVRLAPLYDIASALGYPDVYVPKVKLAMKIGGHYRLSAIGSGSWRRLAEEVRVDPDRIIERARFLTSQLCDAFDQVASDPLVRGLESPLVARLVRAVDDRVDAAAGALA